MATANPMVATPTTPKGMSQEEAMYRGVALSQLRILKQQMQLGGLVMGNRRVTLLNGVEITCSICYGKEDMWVSLPEVKTTPPGPVIESVFWWFVSPAQQSGDDVYLPYHYAEEEAPETGLYSAENNVLMVNEGLLFGNRMNQGCSWNGPLSVYGQLPYPIKGQTVFSNGAAARTFGADQLVLAYATDPHEMALVATYKRNAYDDLVIATEPPVLYVWVGETPLTHVFSEGNLDGGPYFSNGINKIMMASGGFITYSVVKDVKGNDELKVSITKAEDVVQSFSATIQRVSGTKTTITFNQLAYDQLFGSVGRLMVTFITDSSTSSMVGTGSNNITVDLPVKFPITVPVFYGALTAYQADIWRVCFDSDPSKVSTVQAMSFCADDGSGAQIISSGQSCSDFVNNVQHPSSGSVNTVTTCSGTSIQVQVSQNGYSDTINISKTANGQTWVQTSYKSGPIGEMPEVSAAFVASGIGYIYGTFEAWYFNGAWNNYPPSVDTQVSNCLVATGEAGDCTFATPSKLPVGGASNYTRYFHNTCFGNCNFATVEVYEARCL